MSNSILIKDLENVRKKKPIIVLFFSNGCFYCQKMRPDWEQFKKTSPISYSEVPAEGMSEYNPVNDEETIRGYPTIRLYNKGKVIKEYDGDRSHKDIMNFVKKYTKQNKESKLIAVKQSKKNSIKKNLINTIYKKLQYNKYLKNNSPKNNSPKKKSPKNNSPKKKSPKKKSPKKKSPKKKSPKK